MRRYKCRIGCGDPSQQYYHVPRDWLAPAGELPLQGAVRGEGMVLANHTCTGQANDVVIFEERGGDARRVQFVTRALDTVCGSVGEDYPGKCC